MVDHFNRSSFGITVSTLPASLCTPHLHSPYGQLAFSVFTRPMPIVHVEAGASEMPRLGSGHDPGSCNAKRTPTLSEMLPQYSSSSTSRISSIAL